MRASRVRIPDFFQLFFSETILMPELDDAAALSISTVTCVAAHNLSRLRPKAPP